MQVHVIPALPRWGVIVAGGKEATAEALARWIGPRPMHDPHVNGYGAVHTDVWAEEEQLEAWMRGTTGNGVWPPAPGALLFYLRMSV